MADWVRCGSSARKVSAAVPGVWLSALASFDSSSSCVTRKAPCEPGRQVQERTLETGFEALYEALL